MSAWKVQASSASLTGGRSGSPVSRRMPPVAEATSSDAAPVPARAACCRTCSPRRGPGAGSRPRSARACRPVSSMRASPRSSSRKSAAARSAARSGASHLATSAPRSRRNRASGLSAALLPGEYADAVEQCHRRLPGIAHEMHDLRRGPRPRHASGWRVSSSAGIPAARSDCICAGDFPGQRLVLLAEPDEHGVGALVAARCRPASAHCAASTSAGDSRRWNSSAIAAERITPRALAARPGFGQFQHHRGAAGFDRHVHLVVGRRIAGQHHAPWQMAAARPASSH